MAEQNNPHLTLCTLAVLIENKAGALSRLVGLFSQRGYNIESLAVAPTSQTGISRLTLTTYESAKAMEQIKKQVNKLVDVIKIQDMTTPASLERELLLLKLKPSPRRRRDVEAICKAFNTQIIDVFEGGYTVQLIGTMQKIDNLIELLREDEIAELVRSGSCALRKGSKVLEI
ncbi:MAG: acetolactate synthase small subunit [Gammaproteobacteria bacterium]